MQDNNQQKVFMYNCPQRDRIEEFKGCGAIFIGSLLIILGIGAALAEVLLFYFTYIYMYDPYNILTFAGVWIGALYILTGIIAILAGRNKTQCMIITSLVLSVLGIFPGLLGLVWISGAVIEFDIIMFTQLHHWIWQVRLGLDGALIAIGIVSGFLCIVCSALSCAVVCCGRRKAYPEQRYQGVENHAADPYGNHFQQDFNSIQDTSHF